MTLNPVEIFEWMGCVTGVLGSLLLAARHPRAGWGFVLYFFSSCAWLSYGILVGASGLVSMQMVFIATALIGIYNWLIAPRRREGKAEGGGAGAAGVENAG